MMNRRHLLGLGAVGVIGMLTVSAPAILAQEKKSAVVTLAIEGMT